MRQFVFSIMAFSLLGLFSCKANYTDLDVNGFSAKIESPAPVRLIDVRTPEEYSEGHIRGAVNHDWYDSLFVKNVEGTFDKSAPLHIYCRSGKRASEAAKALSKAGFEVFNLKGGYIAWTEAGKPVTKYEVERFQTPGGKSVEITLIKHGTLEVAYDGLSIQFDPVVEHGKHTDYATEFPKADYIFVTHEHGDHLDETAITALTGENTALFLNGTSRDKIGRGEALSNGDSRNLSKGVVVEVVPAYNTTPGREKFHPKGNGNGYVLTLDGFRIYIAGDTEDVPEMAELKDIDVALLPVNQPYTMTVDQCVAATLIFKPKVLIPYHFGQTDISSLPARLPGVDVRLRDMR